MKQLQNILAPLLLLGLMLSSMSSSKSEQKEVISVHSFAKYGANSSASLFFVRSFHYHLYNNLCASLFCSESINKLLILKGYCHVKSNLRDWLIKDSWLIQSLSNSRIISNHMIFSSWA
jgi:hypothetical protein